MILKVNFSSRSYQKAPMLFLYIESCCPKVPEMFRKYFRLSEDNTIFDYIGKQTNLKKTDWQTLLPNIEIEFWYRTDQKSNFWSLVVKTSCRKESEINVILINNCRQWINYENCSSITLSINCAVKCRYSV